jgi:hypothetical protein
VENYTKYRNGVLGVVISSCVLLASCDGGSSYRVASVGYQPQPATTDGSTSSSGGSSSGGTADGSSGGTSSRGTSGGSTSGGGVQFGTATRPVGAMLVVAGNVVLGTASTTNTVAQTVNGGAPVLTPVTGTVTRVLTKTGRTLVDIGNGQTILTGGATNTIGKLVSLGIANNKLIGVSSGHSLIGVNLLNQTPVTGQLVTAGALTGNHLAILDVTKPNAGVIGGLTSGAGAGVATTNPLGGTITRVTSTVHGVTTTVLSGLIH